MMKINFDNIKEERVSMGLLWKLFEQLHPEWVEDDYHVKSYFGEFPKLPCLERMEGAHVLFLTRHQWEDVLEEDVKNLIYVDEVRTKHPTRKDAKWQLLYRITNEDDEIEEVFVVNTDSEYYEGSYRLNFYDSSKLKREEG